VGIPNFFYRNDHVTKTGSAETQGKLKKEHHLCRFFMIPFCVSSYSSMINQECTMGTFVFLFPVADRDGRRLLSAAPDWMAFAGFNASLTALALIARSFVMRPAIAQAGRRVATGAGLCDRLLFPRQAAQAKTPMMQGRA
jgi:hypothetical protein